MLTIMEQSGMRVISGVSYRILLAHWSKTGVVFFLFYVAKMAGDTLKQIDSEKADA